MKPFNVIICLFLTISLTSIAHAKKIARKPITEVSTNNAPAVIGAYSQAVKTQYLDYLSGQIGIDPKTGELVSDAFRPQAEQVFKNLRSVASASGGSINNIAKITVYLTSFENYTALNEVLAQYIDKPYPARSVVQVSALPKGALIEIEGVMAK